MEDYLPGLDEYLARDICSEERTPWAVNCESKSDCGLVYLTRENYDRQMFRMNDTWKCPKCGGPADWNDDNYESFGEV